ncbi:M48 family metallopeptidase [Streptomyces globisporus]|uniref:M48 family metallopeptidase n=1 Tax=Streptomyces globisporus TaxID=1908 RepID=UPI0004CBEC0C|nr:M48 family metallopeptidase [Streptomyces globisporus]
MGATLRALRALVLLAGFHLLGLLLLALLGALDWVAWRWAPAVWALKTYALSFVLAVPVVRGMLMLRTPRDEGVAGVPVTEAEEPRLWSAVRELAGRVGTRAPDEIRLTADMNAAVTEDARLLGLRGGTRRLYLGLPLVAGLSESRLRAVLAHELGHYANSDTRLSGITERSRLHVARTVGRFEEKSGLKVAKERARQERKSARRVAKGKTAREVDTTGTGFSYRVMARIYTAYGRFSMRATQSGSRRQEIAADLAAARIAGRDATASALRALPALDTAHEFYLNSYATLGVEFGMLPPHGEVFGGVRHLLDARAEELAGLRAEPAPEPVTPYDSHPPTAERVATIESLPDDGRAAEEDRPAFALFTSPEAALRAVEDATLTPEALGMRRLDWPDLVHESMTARYVRDTEALRAAIGEPAGADAVGRVDRAAGTDAAGAARVAGSAGRPGRADRHRQEVEAFLDAVDDGAVWDLLDRLPKSEEAAAATGRAAREFARSSLRRELARLLTTALAVDGRARWQLSWSAPASLRLPDGYAEELPAALDAAIADRPDTERLRKLLAAG